MKHRLSGGFTLIELVMTIMVMSIIMVVVGRVMLEGFELSTNSQNISETDGPALVILESMVNDLHTIRSINDLTTISATQLSFVNTDGTSVQFQLSGSTLTRSGQTMATGVQSLTFTYKDENGVTTATPTSVRFIGIAITMAHGNLTSSMSTQAAIRGSL